MCSEELKNSIFLCLSTSVLNTSIVFFFSKLIFVSLLTRSPNSFYGYTLWAWFWLGFFGGAGEGCGGCGDSLGFFVFSFNLVLIFCCKGQYIKIYKV